MYNFYGEELKAVTQGEALNLKEWGCKMVYSHNKQKFLVIVNGRSVDELSYDEAEELLTAYYKDVSYSYAAQFCDTAGRQETVWDAVGNL